LNASSARLKSSTFSCDIARAVSRGEVRAGQEALSVLSTDARPVLHPLMKGEQLC
jgi:hypothetical protein